SCDAALAGEQGSAGAFPAETAPARAPGAAAPPSGEGQIDQSRAPGRRRPGRLHLGCDRGTSARRAARDRWHLRRVGGCGQRGRAGGWTCARRAGGGTAAAGGILASGELWREPARVAARGRRAAVFAGAARSLAKPLARIIDPPVVALRLQP